MTQGRNEIKTQSNLRKDGKVTITVKLIGFDPRYLGAVRFNDKLTENITARIENAVIGLFEPNP